MVDAETGRELVRKQALAFVFGSPSVAGSIVYRASSTAREARDLDSGELLWEFQTEASKRNAAGC